MSDTYDRFGAYAGPAAGGNLTSDRFGAYVEPAAPSSNRNVIIAVGLVILVIALIVGGVFLYKRGKKTTAEAPAPAAGTTAPAPSVPAATPDPGPAPAPAPVKRDKSADTPAPAPAPATKALSVIPASRLTFTFPTGAYASVFPASVCNDPSLAAAPADGSAHLCHSAGFNAKLIIDIAAETSVGKVRFINRTGNASRMNNGAITIKDANGATTGTATVVVGPVEPVGSVYEFAFGAGGAGVRGKTIEIHSRDYLSLHAVAVFEVL